MENDPEQTPRTDDIEQSANEALPNDQRQQSEQAESNPSFEEPQASNTEIPEPVTDPETSEADDTQEGITAKFSRVRKFVGRKLVSKEKSDNNEAPLGDSSLEKPQPVGKETPTQKLDLPETQEPENRADDTKEMPKLNPEMKFDYSKHIKPANILSLKKEIIRSSVKESGVSRNYIEGTIKTWGIKNDVSIHQRSIGQWLGIDPDKWLDQVNSSNPAEEGKEFVPKEIVNEIDRLIRLGTDEKGEGPLDKLAKEKPVTREEAIDIHIKTYAELVKMAQDLTPEVDRLKEKLKNDDLDNEARAYFERCLSDAEKILAYEGVFSVATKGDKFDPQIHRTADQERLPRGSWVVSEVFQNGWRIEHEIIRQAAVNVGRPATGQEQDETEASANVEPKPKARRRGKRGGQSNQTEESEQAEPENARMDRELWDTDKINQALDASEAGSATNEQTELLNKVSGVIHQSETVTGGQSWGGVEIPGERQVIQVAYLKDKKGQMYSVSVDNELAERLLKRRQQNNPSSQNS